MATLQNFSVSSSKKPFFTNQRGFLFVWCNALPLALFPLLGPVWVPQSLRQNLPKKSKKNFPLDLCKVIFDTFYIWYFFQASYAYPSSHTFGDWDETFTTCDLCVLLGEQKPWRCFFGQTNILGGEQ